MIYHPSPLYGRTPSFSLWITFLFDKWLEFSVWIFSPKIETICHFPPLHLGTTYFGTQINGWICLETQKFQIIVWLLIIHIFIHPCKVWAREKLCEGRKVWTLTKISSPNTRYFVAILRFIAIYARFLEKLCARTRLIFGSKQCCLGKKCTITWYILRIVLNKRLQKQRTCRKNIKYAPDKNLMAILSSPKGCQLLPPWCEKSFPSLFLYAYWEELRTCCSPTFEFLQKDSFNVKIWYRKKLN